ncbi:hypothetical protein B0H14DRAFT_3693692 [Mycena olivaceomarginata]|nr:hypothetical protein B0H14DRAFT_3693692 [Mycena olivaceomarginata]
MPTVQSRLDSHRRDAAKAVKILQKARTDAFKDRGYQSAPTRAKLRNEFLERNNGMVAHEWQIDMGEALLLGLDCSLIAGTGAGKTMPFVMPLFMESDKIIIIISPLNALEVDQASRFRKMGLSAVAVNGDTYSNEIHKEIQEFKHRVIITSPDMCLKHDKFRQLLNTPAGGMISVPFMIAFATPPPLVLAEVRKSLHISTDTAYHVNLGTDRPNIAWFVHHMKGAKSDLEALEFLIRTRGSEDAIIELVQSMALEHLRDLLPPHLRGSIALYHSRRSKRSKQIIMDKFRKGEIKILLATEAAGMGCDIPHVEQVVQFMVPSSFSIWMQRAGRAGRNILIAARAILLVQASVFQEVAPKKGAEPTDDVNFKKAVETGLREWIETEECRRDVVDEYFDNGTPRKAPTGICCDNCLRKTSPNHPELTLRPSDDSTAPPPAPPAQYRRDDHLRGARDLITKWRTTICATVHRRRPWGPSAFLPDDVITKIATRAHVKAPADLIHAGWSPTHVGRHGGELLAKLDEYDIEFKQQRIATKKRKMDAQKAETAKRQKLRKDENDAERVRKKALKDAQPKKPRKSRKKFPTLQPSTSSNLPPHSYSTPTALSSGVPALCSAMTQLSHWPTHPTKITLHWPTLRYNN